MTKHVQSMHKVLLQNAYWTTEQNGSPRHGAARWEMGTATTCPLSGSCGMLPPAPVGHSRHCSSLPAPSAQPLPARAGKVCTEPVDAQAQQPSQDRARTEETAVTRQTARNFNHSHAALMLKTFSHQPLGCGAYSYKSRTDQDGQPFTYTCQSA